MYDAVLPSYDYSKKDNKEGKDKRIDASDPKNREEVHKLLFG